MSRKLATPEMLMKGGCGRFWGNSKVMGRPGAGLLGGLEEVDVAVGVDSAIVAILHWFLTCVVL